MARPSLSEASLSQRQRLNALQRFRQPDDPDIAEARRDLVALTLEDHVRQVVDTAPPLTAEQRDRLATLLRGVDRRDGVQVRGRDGPRIENAAPAAHPSGPPGRKRNTGDEEGSTSVERGGSE